MLEAAICCELLIIPDWREAVKRSEEIFFEKVSVALTASAARRAIEPVSRTPVRGVCLVLGSGILTFGWQRSMTQIENLPSLYETTAKPPSTAPQLTQADRERPVPLSLEQDERQANAHEEC